MGEKWPILERNSDIALKQFIDVIQHRALCEEWTIILFRKVGEHDALRMLVDNLPQQFPGLLV